MNNTVTAKPRSTAGTARVSGEQCSLAFHDVGKEVDPRNRVQPRDTQIDTAVIDTTFAVLDESGYARRTLEAVARRAGATKPAIYRRWPTRQHLVLGRAGRRLGEVRAPNTACTLCDISECLILFVRGFNRMPPDVLSPLLTDCGTDPSLRAELMSTLFDPPRAAVGTTVDRAIERGDLRADLDRGAVKTLLRGIATDYSCLLDHARQERSDSSAHRLHAD